MLVRLACDTCGPHPYCLACGATICAHTLDFLVQAPDLPAALRTLPDATPIREDAWRPSTS